jgi:hypothetical protein
LPLLWQRTPANPRRSPPIIKPGLIQAGLIEGALLAANPATYEVH